MASARFPPPGPDAAPPPGLAPATPVATALGWRPVGALQPGDRLLTVDGGAVPMLRLDRIDLPIRLRAVRVPPWALGNRRGVCLGPGQGVVIHSPVAEELYADPFAILPAEALIGWRGILPLPHGRVVMVLPRFAAPQVIYAARELLVACPGASGGAVGAVQPLLEPVIFPPDQARHLARCLMAADLGQGLRASQAATGVVPS